jgi:hypothetical protein
VSNIRGDGVSHMINLVVLLAAQQCLADERVTQIVDAGLRMATAGNPTQTAAETVEGVMDGSLRDRLPACREKDRLKPLGDVA